MNVIECYGLIGDYKDVSSRLPNDALIKRFLGKFTQDQSFGELKAALEAEDTENAFCAAHTLKGVCANLSITNLGADVIEITEKLRGGNLDEARKLFPQAEEKYRMTMEAIAKLD